MSDGPVLHCQRCGAAHVADLQTWRCPACRGSLEWRGGERFSRDMIDSSRAGLWRYWRALPVSPDGAVSLGETMTGVVPISLDGAHALAKLEGQMPTGSYKDRGAAVLVTFLRDNGATTVVEDSSGNAGAAMAGYAGRAGIDCTIFCPAHASPGKLVQVVAYGAQLEKITGNRDDVARAAEEASTRPGSAYATHNWHPFFEDGIKTWAYEIWEQLGYQAPDVIVSPVGSGTVILGAWKAFSSLLAAGEITKMPRMYAAQAAYCAPLKTALDAGADETKPFDRTTSIAEGIMIANPIRGRELLHILRTTGGGATAMTEAEIGQALRDLARQGVYAEPTSATAAAAWRSLVASGEIGKDERTVVVLTGNGLKATSAIADLVGIEI